VWPLQLEEIGGLTHEAESQDPANGRSGGRGKRCAAGFLDWLRSGNPAAVDGPVAALADTAVVIDGHDLRERLGRS